MATKTSSQSHKSGGLDAGVEQLDSFFGTYTKYESRGVRFAAEAIDESARLAKDWVIYAGEISAEAPRTYADAWRRAAPAAIAAAAPAAKGAQAKGAQA